MGGEWATWWKEQAMGIWASAASLTPATVTCGGGVCCVGVRWCVAWCALLPFFGPGLPALHVDASRGEEAWGHGREGNREGGRERRRQGGARQGPLRRLALT